MIPKFRCFDKETKKIQDVLAIDFSTGTVKITQYNVVWFMQENNRSMSEVILMQSTGLYDSTKFEDLSEEEQEEWLESGKDANEWHGREIFEGDILTSQDGTDGLISRFIVKRDEFYTGFTPMNREGCGFNRTMCEVIGNVHQHPELLEDV